MKMRKRILVAEAADTVRGIAESVLRQNGFEVIAVGSAEKAKEVLQFARPDLVVVGADLRTNDQRPFFEKLQSDPRTATLPLLLFEPVDPMDLPFPQEVIIPRPFDPQDFITRVKTFSGSGDSRPAAQSPLASTSVDDEFLDAALGLDRIDVTDSEVMNRTSTGMRIQPQAVNRDQIFAQEEHEQRALGESQRVESLMIRDDQTDIVRKKPAPPKTAPAPSGTSKLEIMSDQYGMTDPEAFKMEQQEEAQAHDYDWFVNSMRDEYGAGAKPAAPAKSAAPAKLAPVAQDSQSLRIAQPSSLIDPVTPGPKSQVETRAVAEERPVSSSRSAGVDKFIDEFKKEIERLRSNEPDSVFIDESRSTAETNGQGMGWEETLEKVTPKQVEIFTKQLAADLAEKIAEKIVAKIDSQRLLELIKNEIIARHKQNQGG